MLPSHSGYEISRVGPAEPGNVNQIHPLIGALNLKRGGSCFLYSSMPELKGSSKGVTPDFTVLNCDPFTMQDCTYIKKVLVGLGGIG